MESLLASDEPAVGWKVRTAVLGEPVGPVDPRSSPAVRQLLARFDERPWPDAYAKWQGAHWVLSALADLGYPPGDAALEPLREQVLERWLGREMLTLQGRPRVHGSQAGNALRSLITLGLADERCEQLADLLLRGQWPDGGWNCDRHPGAHTSSFHETLLPMRGLWAHGTAEAKHAARAAAEVFLTRRLAYRASTGELIHPEFLKLHYPRYWHYDILGGLLGLSELGLLTDPRCADALDLLESMRLPDGWPAHARYGSAPDIDWGGTSKRRANPWVTADALTVLAAAGRR